MIEPLLNHRTIRKFRNQAIENQKMDQILLAATRASNTGNMQLYSIIVTTSEELKSQLCEKVHFNQALVKQAAAVLTFCVDIRRFSMWCQLRDTKAGFDNFLTFYTASIDACLAAQNACLAAEDLGLGICYLGTANYNIEPQIELLHLPQGVIPATAIAIGYPEDVPPLIDRLPIEAVVHYETYKDYTAQYVGELYAEKEALPLHRQLVQQNEVQNLAQIFTQKRYTHTNNCAFTKKMLEALKMQGFMNNELEK